MGTKKLTKSVVSKFTEDEKMQDKISSITAIGMGLLVNKILFDGVGAIETVATELSDTANDIEALSGTYVVCSNTTLLDNEAVIDNLNSDDSISSSLQTLNSNEASHWTNSIFHSMGGGDENIQLYTKNSSEVNAFFNREDRSITLTKGLLEEAVNYGQSGGQEVVVGTIAHEIGHALQEDSYSPFLEKIKSIFTHEKLIEARGEGEINSDKIAGFVLAKCGLDPQPFINFLIDINEESEIYTDDATRANNVMNGYRKALRSIGSSFESHEINSITGNYKFK